MSSKWPERKKNKSNKLFFLKQVACHLGEFGVNDFDIGEYDLGKLSDIFKVICRLCRATLFTGSVVIF